MVDETSVQAVQGQLDAYNARDIEAFMAWWAEDCRYYAFPDQLLAHGTAEVRARHVARFQEPNLFGSLVTRIALGNLVVDQERVTRTFPEGSGEVDVVAIYDVQAGKIAKAWFKMGAPLLHVPGVPGAFLRRAGAEDADAVRALTREAYAKWVPVIGREPRPMTADYEAAVREHRVDLLEIEGVLAGLIETVPDPDGLLIENVAVLPGSQGRGLGRALMAHAEGVARSLGLGVLRLYTNAAFAENVRLYRGLGFGVDREEEFMGGVTVYMSKTIERLKLL